MSKANRAGGKLAVIQEILAHPIRTRIVGWLRHKKPSTQREMGRALCMSTAKVHYHLKLLVGVGLVELADTRPGPKGITEKLFKVNLAAWKAQSKHPGRDDMDMMLHYTVDWMREHHREGVALLEGAWDRPFVAGSYRVHCARPELIRFKRKIDKLFEQFAKKPRDPARKDEHETWSLTFSAMPSRAEGPDGNRIVFEFEPQKA